MFLQENHSGDLIRVDDIEQLFNPMKSEVYGRDQAGEEEQDLVSFQKDELIFPSGGALPRCWTDPNYQFEKSRPLAWTNE